MGGERSDSDRHDSVVDLIDSPLEVDELERDEAFEQVAQGLLATRGPPRRIGRYALAERLGHGGQGVVYAAHDPELDRRVAIKILQVHGKPSEAAARLRREATALAQLSHPNVISINDVGVCQYGLYFVMQYVPGRTLSQWLTQDRPWRDVFDVFVDAGRGLAAAHSAGIVHRDFKPSNVWMGDDGVVRLLDFGLAQDVTEPLASSEDKTTKLGSAALTAEGFVAGTPPYMAPEQHDGRRATEATDQYAYCVTLYEALFGQRPFGASTIQALVLAKSEAHIPPPPPGSAVPKSMWPLLVRGLQPDPSDRWPSMLELLEQMQRACEPPRRLARFMALASVVVGACVAGVYGWQGMQRTRVATACAQEAEDLDEAWNPTRADEIGAAFEATGIAYAGASWSRARPRLQAFVDTWKRVRRDVCEANRLEGTLTEATAEAARACLQEHRETLVALLDHYTEPNEVVVRQVGTTTASLPLLELCMDPSSLHQRLALPSDPQVREQTRELRARLKAAAAARFAGRHALSLELAQAALDDATALGVPPLVARAKFLVGVALVGLGRSGEAEPVLEEAYFDAQQSGRDEVALEAASWLVVTVGERLARPDDGLRWHRAATTLIERMDRPDDLVVAGVLANTCNVHFARGDDAQALELAEQALEIKQRVLGSDHPEVANLYNAIGSIRHRQGASGEALAWHERALAVQREVLGPQHPELGITFNNFATVHLDSGDREKALAMFERAFNVWKSAHGEEHPRVAAALNNVGITQQLLDAHADAMHSFERAIAIGTRTLGPDHPQVASSLSGLANVHQALGEYGKAAPLYVRALTVFENAYGPKHPEVARQLGNLGTAYFYQGKHEEALARYERALEIWKERAPEGTEVARMINNMGFVELARGEYGRARELHEQAVVLWERAHGPMHPEVGRSVLAVGDVHAAQHEYRQALPNYERALVIYEHTAGEAAQLAATRFALAQALWQTDSDRSRAVALAEKAREGYESLGKATSAEHGEVRKWLATRDELH